MATRYLIAGHKRSGTTLTHLLLVGHPAVAALGDEMNAQPFTKGIAAYTSQGVRRLTQAEQSEGTRRLFDAIAGANATPDTTTIGAKIAYGAKVSHLVDSIGENFPELRIILIHRRDLVAQLGSIMQRKRTGVAHSWNPRQREISMLKISKPLFSYYAVKGLRALDGMRKLKKTNDVLEVCYESMSDNMDREYRRIVEFLGLDFVPPTWLKAKKVLPSPESYISNYAEVRALQDWIEERYPNCLPKGWWLRVKAYNRIHRTIFRKANRGLPIASSSPASAVSP